MRLFRYYSVLLIVLFSIGCATNQLHDTSQFRSRGGAENTVLDEGSFALEQIKMISSIKSLEKFPPDITVNVTIDGYLSSVVGNIFTYEL